MGTIAAANLGGGGLADATGRRSGSGLRTAAEAQEPRSADASPTERRAPGAADAVEPAAGSHAEAPSRVAPPKGAELADFPLRKLSFRVDAETHEVVVSVVDERSGEVVRQIPPEEALRVAKALERVRGLLVDERG